MDMRKLVGRHVKRIRLEKGLTQEQLADHAGFFRTYMSRIETGDANPTFDALLVLATALRVAPAALFEPPDSLKPTSMRATSTGPKSRLNA